MQRQQFVVCGFESEVVKEQGASLVVLRNKPSNILNKYPEETEIKE